jgi:hypothetical protein
MYERNMKFPGMSDLVGTFQQSVSGPPSRECGSRGIFCGDTGVNALGFLGLPPAHLSLRPSSKTWVFDLVHPHVGEGQLLYRNLNQPTRAPSPPPIGRHSLCNNSQPLLDPGRLVILNRW